MNFEAFGSSPDFTTPIQQFLYNNCSKIEEAKQKSKTSEAREVRRTKLADKADK